MEWKYSKLNEMVHIFVHSLKANRSVYSIIEMVCYSFVAYYVHPFFDSIYDSINV